jgi:hypothetical protein
MGDSHIVDEAKRVRERANAVSFDFVIEELELGSTFCRIALGAFRTRLQNTPCQRRQSLPNGFTSRSSFGAKRCGTQTL